MPAQKKKMLILAILGILRDETDADHRIRQAAIIEKLNANYQLSATRKSVRKNLADLQEAGYPILFRKGWYYDHTFKPAELDYLLDCIMSSNIPTAQREDLLNRLLKMGGSFYKPHVDIKKVRPTNPQFLQTLDVIHDAIADGRQITFKYCDYDVDKELHPRLDNKGKAKTYKVNPYRLASANGRSYLICNVDKYDTLCHFRVDRIVEARMMRAAAKPLEKIKDNTDSLASEAYVNEHPYMYSGKPIKTRIEVPRDKINDVLDWFGTEVGFEDVSEEKAVAVVVSDPVSVELWLRRYGDFARVV